MQEKQIVHLKHSAHSVDDTIESYDGKSDAKLLREAGAIHHYYENESLGLYVGVSDVFEITLPTDCDAFMRVLAGTLEIQNKHSQTDTIVAGKSLVIPQGFDCRRYQQESFRQLYVIYKPKVRPKNCVADSILYIDEKSDIPWQATSDGHRKKVLYQNNDQSFKAGVWQSKALSTGLIAFPYNEFIFINEGELFCTDDTGAEHHYRKGDALFIPQGTHCKWQVKDEVSIHFAQVL